LIIKWNNNNNNNNNNIKSQKGIINLKLLSIRKKNKVAHGSGESLFVVQTSSMQPPPQVVRLTSKTCDSPPPSLHPTKKERLNRKRPFLSYTEKEAPCSMSKSDAIFREVFSLKQRFGEATNIGSHHTTNL
jgi:hypothetical protein